MLFGRKRMVAAPEGAAGASGGGTAPASGVRSPASPAGGGNPFPLSTGAQPDRVAGASPQPGDHDGGAPDELDLDQGGQDNAIPYSRVKQMREGWQKKAREEGLTAARQELLREFAPVLEELTQLRELRQQFDPAAIKQGVAEAFLESLGVKKEQPKPQYVTREEYESGLQKERQRFESEAQHRADLQRAHADVQAARQRHAKIFEAFPAIEEIAASVWGTPYAVQNKIPMGAIIDALAKQFEAAVGKFNAEYVEGKERDGRDVPITPGPTPTPGKKTGKADYSPEATAAAAVKFLEGRLSK